MRITASIPSVEEIVVNVSPNTTVENLKNFVCRKLHIEPELSRLLIRGQNVSPKLRISELDLSEKVVVDYLWARHLILWGREGQRRIRDATVLVAGAGAIGNEVAKNLAMLGIGRLAIVDFDIVELSNTSRMVFFDMKTVGQSKARSLARSIAKKYPHTSVVAYDSKLENLPLSVYLGTDIIVCGLDNVISRIFLSRICSRYRIPIVDGGMQGYRARVQTYVPSSSPCLACVYTPSQYAQLTGLRNPCDPSIQESKTPSLPTTTSLVSAIQTNEVLKMIVGYPIFSQTGAWPRETGQPMRGIWIADLNLGQCVTMPLDRNERCVVCGKEGVSREFVRRTKVPIRDLGRSTRSIRRAILRFLPKKTEDVRISRINSQREQRITEKTRMGHNKIKTGEFLQVTFMSDPGTYEELIVKVV